MNSKEMASDAGEANSPANLSPKNNANNSPKSGHRASQKGLEEKQELILANAGLVLDRADRDDPPREVKLLDVISGRGSTRSPGRSFVSRSPLSRSPMSKFVQPLETSFDQEFREEEPAIVKMENSEVVVQVNGETLRGTLNVSLPESEVKRDPKKILKFPKLTTKHLKEAVNQHYLTEKESLELIRNPNKYSLFFANVDINSPHLRQALSNLDYKASECLIKGFDEFQDERLPPIQIIISYLTYLTAKYPVLKEIYSERNRLKSLEKEILKKFQREMSKNDRTLDLTLVSDAEKGTLCTSVRRLDDRSMLDDEEFKLRLKENKMKFIHFSKKIQTYVQNLKEKVQNQEQYMSKMESLMEEKKRRKEAFIKEKMNLAHKSLEKVERFIERRSQKENDILEEYNQKILERERELRESKKKNREKAKKPKMTSPAQSQSLDPKHFHPRLVTEEDTDKEVMERLRTIELKNLEAERRRQQREESKRRKLAEDAERGERVREIHESLDKGEPERLERIKQLKLKYDAVELKRKKLLEMRIKSNQEDMGKLQRLQENNFSRVEEQRARRIEAFQNKVAEYEAKMNRLKVTIEEERMKSYQERLDQKRAKIMENVKTHQKEKEKNVKQWLRRSMTYNEKIRILKEEEQIMVDSRLGLMHQYVQNRDKTIGTIKT